MPIRASPPPQVPALSGQRDKHDLQGSVGVQGLPAKDHDVEQRADDRDREGPNILADSEDHEQHTGQAAD
jgi:hypothetical protein